MIEINYDKNSELKFTLDISGHPGNIDEIRLVLDKDDKKVCYMGKLEDGVVTVQLSGLNEVFSPGEHDYSLEIIIGNQYFKPIKDKIILKEDVKITSKVLESNTINSNTIAVTKVETKKDVELKKKEEVKKPIAEIFEDKKKESTKISKFLVEDQGQI